MRYHFTLEQLLELYQATDKKPGWFMSENQLETNPTLDLSSIEVGHGSVRANGYWKFHLSIDPIQMLSAIPIVYHRWSTYPGITGMKMANAGLMKREHQSGKQFAIIFDESEENSRQGRIRIISFLAALAYDLIKAGIRPEQRHVLTPETEVDVALLGNAADRSNIGEKYDARLKFHQHEEFSYFNYRAERPTLLTHADYQLMNDDDENFVDVSTIRGMDPRFKHNPLRADDPYYGLILDQHLLSTATNKQDFLFALKFKLLDQRLTRADILDLFAEIKNPHGPYAFIHAQRHPSFDRFRLLFKSEVRGQNEQNFWHTKTYQTAVKMLKNAYINMQDELPPARKDEENAFIDYVRGNSVMHCSSTSTRASLRQ